MSYSLPQPLVNALNKQASTELYAVNFYTSASHYLKSIGCDNAANHMLKESEEERTHAAKFFDHLQMRGAVPVIEAIPAPPNPQSFTSFLNVFEEAYKLEAKVTDLINNLMTLARDNNDVHTKVFLQFFVEHQYHALDEISSFNQKIGRIENAQSQLMLIDMNFAKLMTPGGMQ